MLPQNHPVIQKRKQKILKRNFEEIQVVTVALKEAKIVFRFRATIPRAKRKKQWLIIHLFKTKRTMKLHLSGKKFESREAFHQVRQVAWMIHGLCLEFPQTLKKRIIKPWKKLQQSPIQSGLGVLRVLPLARGLTEAPRHLVCLPEVHRHHYGPAQPKTNLSLQVATPLNGPDHLPLLMMIMQSRGQKRKGKRRF